MWSPDKILALGRKKSFKVLSVPHTREHETSRSELEKTVFTDTAILAAVFYALFSHWVTEKWPGIYHLLIQWSFYYVRETPKLWLSELIWNGLHSCPSFLPEMDGEILPLQCKHILSGERWGRSRLHLHGMLTSGWGEGKVRLFISPEISLLRVAIQTRFDRVVLFCFVSSESPNHAEKWKYLWRVVFWPKGHQWDNEWKLCKYYILDKNI